MPRRFVRHLLATTVLLTPLVLFTSCNVFSIIPPLLASQPGTTTTIILVRHSERDPGLDPPLNAEGLVRREALRNVLKQNGVTAIYTGDVIRNHQTVELIADELGIEPVIIGAAELADTKALANRLVNEWLTLHAGGVVLWVGNTGPVTEFQGGNLEEIFLRLGGTGAPPNRYQDLYIVVVPDEGEPHFIKTEFGGPSSLD